MSHYEDMEEYNPNQIEEQFIIDGDSVTKETYQSFKDLERQLEEEKAKSKALLVGLEVQHLNEFLKRANVENYKELGENITIGFKTQLKEQG